MGVVSDYVGRLFDRIQGELDRRDLALECIQLRDECAAAHRALDARGYARTAITPEPLPLDARLEMVWVDLEETRAAFRSSRVVAGRYDWWRSRARAWKALAKRYRGELSQLRTCETCDGDGIMDVVVRVLPPDGDEVTEPVTCAECDGSGIGHLAATAAGLARIRAALSLPDSAAVDEVCERARELRSVKPKGGCMCTYEEGDSACPVHPSCPCCGMLYPGDETCSGCGYVIDFDSYTPPLDARPTSAPSEPAVERGPDVDAMMGGWANDADGNPCGVLEWLNGNPVDTDDGNVMHAVAHRVSHWDALHDKLEAMQSKLDAARDRIAQLERERDAARESGARTAEKLYVVKCERNRAREQLESARAETEAVRSNFRCEERISEDLRHASKEIAEKLARVERERDELRQQKQEVARDLVSEILHEPKQGARIVAASEEDAEVLRLSQEKCRREGVAVYGHWEAFDRAHITTDNEVASLRERYELALEHQRAACSKLIRERDAARDRIAQLERERDDARHECEAVRGNLRTEESVSADLRHANAELKRLVVALGTFAETLFGTGFGKGVRMLADGVLPDGWRERVQQIREEE